MKIEVDVIAEDARWEALGLAPLAERAVTAALSARALVDGAYEVAVLGCDDARIAALNADFRGKPQPTNVLSWPSEERAAPGQHPAPPAPGELGDLALAYETCAQEAEIQGKPLPDHVTHLVVHGVLHLLGYDHESDTDAALMEALEVEILATLGVADPY